MEQHGIRSEPLSKEEKTELTAILHKLRLMPRCGQVTLHINDYRVTMIEPRWSV